MAIKENHGLDGRVRIVLREPDGTIVDDRMVHNLITTAGRKLLGQLFTSDLGKPHFQIAVGGDDTAATVADTALGKQIDAVDATVSSPKTIDENQKQLVIVTVSATLPATGNANPQSLKEAGILITLAGQPPVLYNHVTFPVITRTGNLEMTLTWEVIF